MMNDQERGHVNITEAAALLGVSRVTLWRWIRDGRLPVTRLGHRTTRIDIEDLERALTPAGSHRSRLAVSEQPGTEIAAMWQTVSLSAPQSDWTKVDATGHIVQFYESDAFLLDAVEEFIGAALRAGDIGIVVATASHRQGLEERFQAGGLDVAALAANGQYVVLDAAETLSRFMVDGMPDSRRFRDVIGGLIAGAARDGHRTRVFGEMVALLAVEGNHGAAIRLEELWNELQQTQPFALFCAYPMEQPGGQAFADLLRDVCAGHTQVIPAESYTALSTHDERLRAITVLQQKAHWLEAEIAERQRAEEHLRVALAAESAARQEAEAALRLRDEFLSIAAHELKTPLTGLAAHAQLLLRQIKRNGHVEPARVEQAAERIRDQAGKLSELLNQLLDVSRLEAGKLILERRPTDLTTLVKEVVANIHACSGRHSIGVTVPASLTTLVDPLRLEQVLTNLLDNAVKYSPDDSPIDVTLSRTSDGMAELAVRDRGLGIPPEQRGQIFERFYQAHGNGHKHGLGLGLYISHQIVDLHGGEIRIESPPNGGTRVIVRLPVEESALAAIAADG